MALSLTDIPFFNKRVKFPVTPHIPGGLTSPDQLRQIAQVAEQYGGTIKIVGGGITIMGLNVADGEQVLAALGVKPESFIAKAIRGVAICPGIPHCPRAQQDSTGLGLALDNEFFGQPVPGKLRIGVSGCPNCCAEVFVKDIGLFGTPRGFTLVAGGNAGRQAKIGRILAVDIPPDEVPAIIRAILEFYRVHAVKNERLGNMIERLGLEPFMDQTIPASYRGAED